MIGYGTPLPAGFYDRDAAAAARDLLGAVVRHETHGGMVSDRIVETEAYLGPHDPVSHAAVGPRESPPPCPPT
ncbi:MAG: DNA-3-methyladenine glycosylase [Gemmatimonas sp.]|uniref:DNA-3-methyladenine glycosylase n=1 Tax=Gemmatimonas sp. TaxID=1962908 RepID=UPI00391A17B4